MSICIYGLIGQTCEPECWSIPSFIIKFNATMSVKIVELIPNRQFIDPDFNGYKLSLDAVPILEKPLETPVDRVLADSNRYSLLHAKLFGLHNHLIGETIGATELVYLVDESWWIKKIFVDDTGQVQIIDLLKIARSRKGTLLDYNVSLKLLNETVAIFSDGAGKIYIIETGPRKQSNHWKCSYVLDALDDGGGFIIQDARLYESVNDEPQIHCLLYRIEQIGEKEQKLSGVLVWVVLSKQKDIWKKIESRKLFSSNSGTIYYAYFESTCEALYVISDGTVHFTRDNDMTTLTKCTTASKKKYCWSQTHNHLTIKLKFPNDLNIDCLYVNTQSTEISVLMNDENIFSGRLSHLIDNNLTTWSIENGFLEIRIFKQEEGLLWTSLISGDDTGEYVVNTILIEEIHEKLTNFCSEHVSTPSPITFNSQQVEECDLKGNRYTTFQRLSRQTCETTHTANVDTHTLVLIVGINPHLPPAIAFRHDVDAFVWQPIFENDELHFKHEGTLKAFGYVQASKEQRKFSVCAPNFAYCVICETLRHIFIYNQEKTVNEEEIRQRTAGKRIKHIAKQQVINLHAGEIFGIHAAESKLFLLTKKSIYVLSL